MNPETPTISTRLNILLFWILVNTVAGVLVYATVVVVVAAALDLAFQAPMLTILLLASPLAGALGGSVAGFGGWAALRRRLPGAEGWALATILGWVLGLFLATGVFTWLLPDGLSYSTLLVPFAAGGAVSGLLQERILRKWVTGQAWWVFASASGWLLGWIVALGTRALYLPERGLTPGLTVLLLGSIHGAIIGLQSGTTLVVLLGAQRARVWEGQKSDGKSTPDADI